MTRIVRLVGLAILGTGLLTGCERPLSLAVENHDPTAYLLRVVDGRHRAWRIPPMTAGTGPLNDGTEKRFVMIAALDCTELGRLGLATGELTLIVEGGGLADPDLRESIDADLAPLEQIVDPCL